MDKRTEWGLMLDCVAQGCNPHHRDHGRVFDYKPGDHEINGHAATPVVRSVIYLPWQQIPNRGTL